MDEESHMNYLHNLQSKQALIQKLSRDTNINPGAFTSMSDNNNNNINNNNISIPSTSQSHCVLLSNLFDPNNVNLSEDPSFFIDTQTDVVEECNNYGVVEEVIVDEDSRGNVWIKFANNNYQAAKVAVEKLNGRWFSGRPVDARLIPENYYNENSKKLE
jgi:RNA-binding protein 39